MVVIAAANRIYAKVGVGGHKYKLFRKPKVGWGIKTSCSVNAGMPIFTDGQPKKVFKNIYSCHHSRPSPWKKGGYGGTDGGTGGCVCVNGVPFFSEGFFLACF